MTSEKITINRVPAWFVQAVERYQQAHGLKSQSAAILQLAVLGYHRWSVETDKRTDTGLPPLGSEEVETEIMTALTTWEESGGKSEDPAVDDTAWFLMNHAAGRNWGGNRSKVTMKCGWCGHVQDVTSPEDECRSCGECEFVSL